MKDETEYLSRTTAPLLYHELFNRLNARQRAVHSMAVCGYSNKDMAQAADMSGHVIASDLSEIFALTGTNGKLQLTALHFGPLSTEQLLHLTEAYKLKSLETDVLQSLAEGLSGPQIMTRLNLTFPKVKFIVKALARKLGAHGSYDLPMIAHTFPVPSPAEAPTLKTFTPATSPSCAKEIDDTFFDDLGSRERDTVGHLIAGSHTKEIAQALHISPTTVAEYIKWVFRKLEVHSREEILAQYFGPPDEPQLQAAISDYKITPPEAKILRVALQGKSRKEIAEETNLSAHTVGDHLRALYRKMNVHNKDELFLVVHSHGAFAKNYHHEPVPSFAA